MDQDKLWRFYQGEAKGSFAGARPRLRWLARRLPVGARVLNIGIGDGAFEEEAARNGLRPFSLDPDERAVAVQRTVRGEASAQVGYADRIPWPDASFDAVVMSEVLEHIPEGKLAASIADVHRVLVPGGRFIGTVPCEEDLSASIVLCPCCGEKFHRWGHVRSFTVESLRNSLGVFASVAVEKRLFLSLVQLNWKGKILAMCQYASWRATGKASSQSLVFDCRKASSPA